MQLGVQVKTSVLKDGTKLESDIVLVGVGARPNIELFKGQLDMLEERPGGIKARLLAQLPLIKSWGVGTLSRGIGEGQVRPVCGCWKHYLRTVNFPFAATGSTSPSLFARHSCVGRN